MLQQGDASRHLKRQTGGAKRAHLPAVFFVTDPSRTPDPVAAVMGLPRGAGVIYRGFGRPEARQTAQALAKIARQRGLVLLIGADAGLAARVGADGVHLPERTLHKVRSIRQHHPNWLVTGAVHSSKALQTAGRLGLAAALLSSAFPSRSSSATGALGPVRIAGLTRSARLPVIALGGVNGRTAKRLVGTGVAGFAAVDGLS